jgi:hypothetical protein
MSSSSENRSASGTEHLIAGFFGGLIPTGTLLYANSITYSIETLNKLCVASELT